MGREIRRVPPNWQHPQDKGQYVPLFDNDAESAFEKWLSGYQEWVKEGLQKIIQDHPDFQYDINQPYRTFCDWQGNPPDPESYRTKWKEEPTWYQVYETVTEGTPVTPPFATQDELIDYLCNHGTFWYPDQKWSQEAAEKFVRNSGYMPSFVIAGGSLIDYTQRVI